MNRKTLSALVSGAAVAAALAAPAAGQAAVRYVSTTGSGTDCSVPLPCDLKEGVTNAKNLDHVQLDPGDYKVNGELHSTHSITVEGEGGIPRILFAGPGAQLDLVPGSNVRYLDIQGTVRALTLPDGVVEGSVLRGSGSGDAVAVLGGKSSVVNSAIFASGTSATGALVQANGTTESALFDNVTVQAPGSSATAIEAKATGATGGAFISMRNTIARGGGLGLQAVTNNGGAEADVTAYASNFPSSVATGSKATVTAAGADKNQTAAPLLAADGIHELKGSPTVDHGIYDYISEPRDFDSQARRQGAGTDIGADELVPPKGGGVPAKPQPQPKPQPQTQPSGPVTTADHIAPVLTRLGVRRGRVAFRLSEGATVTLRVQRRGHHGWRTVRRLNRTGKAGRNRLRLFRHAGAGRYRVYVSARDGAGNRSLRRSVRFRIRRR